MKKHKIGVTDIILAALGLLYLAGVRFVFQSCDARDDGSWMTCHWAHQALIGVASALMFLSVVHLIPNAGAKCGLDVALAALAAVAIRIPGGLIDLCMMDTMRCRAVMRPGVIVLSVLVIVASFADIFVQQKRGKA